MKTLKPILLSILMAAVVFSFSFVAPFDMGTEAHAATDSSYRLDDKTITVYLDETHTQKLYNSKDLTVTATRITWKSNNKKIATISEKGKITGVKVGETTMTAKYKGKTYKFTVTVKSSALHLSKRKVTFKDSKLSTTVKISADRKYTAGGFVYELLSGKDNVSVSWGKWNGNTIPLKIECKNPGAARIRVYPADYPKKGRIITVNYNRGYKTCYESDFYRVGDDMPAGEYVVFANSPGSGAQFGYACISEDAGQKTITSDKIFEYNTIIKVKKGEYLELVRCHAVPIAKAKVDTSAVGGTYKAGTHIEPGDYRLTNTDYPQASYAILNSPQGEPVAEGEFETKTYVTLEEGQYLTLYHCSCSLVEPLPEVEVEEINNQ